jgi:hypothetical protein
VIGRIVATGTPLTKVSHAMKSKRRGRQLKKVKVFD